MTKSYWRLLNTDCLEGPLVTLPEFSKRILFLIKKTIEVDIGDNDEPYSLWRKSRTFDFNPKLFDVLTPILRHLLCPGNKGFKRVD